MQENLEQEDTNFGKSLDNLFKFCKSCYFERVCKADEKIKTMYYGECNNFKKTKERDVWHIEKEPEETTKQSSDEQQ